MRLYARGPRFRLDAEAIRDQALFVSGLLVDKLGGPPVKPPQPAGLWQVVAYPGSDTGIFVADKEADKVHRRTLYTLIKRTATAPQLSTFDAPDRESCCVRRERTNTPQQALLLMNDPQFVEAARALAARTLHDGGDSEEQRAAYLLRVCTGRWPSEADIDELVKGVRSDLAYFQAHPKFAAELTLAKSSESCAESAAWTMAANMVLCMDDAVTKN